MNWHITISQWRRWFSTAQPWVLGTCVLLLTTGLYQALIVSPPDYQQGEAVRIMYVHVPAAWMALGVYAMLSVLSAIHLIWKGPLSAIMARQAAPIGAAFTLLCLITGAIWGKPMWGAWWVWDARLTSVLILLFIYMAYIGLHQSFDDKATANRMASIFALIGLINIPIIKFSVDWWNTLHQPASIIRSEGIAIHGSMLIPLLLMFGFYISWFVWVWMVKVETQLAKEKQKRSPKLA